jgi:hypothetical protein
MPIIGIRQSEARDERFIVRDQTVADVGIHELSRSGE